MAAITRMLMSSFTHHTRKDVSKTVFTWSIADRHVDKHFMQMCVKRGSFKIIKNHNYRSTHSLSWNKTSRCIPKFNGVQHSLRFKSKASANNKTDCNHDPVSKTHGKDWENFLSKENNHENISKLPTVKENIFTIPNLLSISRIIATPYISYLVIHNQYNFALGLFVAAGVTDLLDGMIARKWPSQQSALGTALDPLSDKILVTALTLSLTSAGIIPAPLMFLIVSRDIGLVLAVFYLRYKTCPPPRTVKRYFDPTLVNTKLSPTTISKYNTLFQMCAISASMCAPVWGFVNHPLLNTLYAATAVTTIWSGASYMVRKDTVHVLKSDKT